MFQLARALGTEAFRLSEDWVEAFTLQGAGDPDDPLSVADAALKVVLVDLYRPGVTALALTEGDGLEINPRDDGADTITVVIRAPTARVSAALRPHDYRLDLYAEAGGQIGRFASGVRQFRE